MNATPKKPQRTLHYNRLSGILHLADRRGEVGYYLDRLESDLGPAYRLTKILATPGEPDHYDVLISSTYGSCECKGHLYTGHCKHVDSVRVLRQRGDLAC